MDDLIPLLLWRVGYEQYNCDCLVPDFDEGRTGSEAGTPFLKEAVHQIDVGEVRTRFCLLRWFSDSLLPSRN